MPQNYKIQSNSIKPKSQELDDILEINRSNNKSVFPYTDSVRALINGPSNKWNKLLLDNSHTYDYMKFLSLRPNYDIPSIIANKISNYVVGKEIKINSENKELRDYINFIFERDSIYTKMQVLIKTASLFGDCVMFLLPMKKGGTKDYVFSIAIAPMSRNGYTSSINYEAQQMVLYWFGEDSFNIPLYKIIIDKKKFILQQYDNSEDISTFGENTQKTATYKTVYMFPYDLDVLPVYIFRNRSTPLNGYMAKTQMYNNTTCDVYDCYKLVYLAQLTIEMTHKELNNSRSRLAGQFDQYEMDRITQHGGNIYDIDFTMNGISTVGKGGYGNNMNNVVLNIPADPKTLVYSDFLNYLLKTIGNSANIDYEDFTQDNYENKANATQKRSLTVETIEFRRTLMLRGLYYLIDIILAISSKSPKKNKSYININRDYTIVIDSSNFDDWNTINTIIDLQLQNKTISQVDAIMKLHNLDRKEAEEKWEEIKKQNQEIIDMEATNDKTNQNGSNSSNSSSSNNNNKSNMGTNNNSGNPKGVKGRK